jgi:hypothetical protein
MFSNVPVEEVTVVGRISIAGKGAVNRIGVHAPSPQIG